MQDNTSSASDIRRTGGRFVAVGIGGILLLLIAAAILLIFTLPDAGAFDARVERMFVENADLTSQAEIKLLEILAQSGTAFSDTLASYRLVILVLLIFATSMMIAALVFLVLLVGFNRRMAQIERAGIQVNSLLISREENTVYLNNLGFKLTDAAMETMSVLAEARMDDDVLSGAEIEGVISGRSSTDCDEAAGATRIKRLRDTLGNQIVSELAGQEHRAARLYAVGGKGRDQGSLIFFSLPNTPAGGTLQPPEAAAINHVARLRRNSTVASGCQARLGCTATNRRSTCPHRTTRSKPPSKTEKPSSAAGFRLATRWQLK